LKRGLSFHLVEEVEDVLKLALIPPLLARVGNGGAAKAPPKPVTPRPRSRSVSV
jgi:hypothetical protein